jgi:hypothetical protein
VRRNPKVSSGDLSNRQAYRRNRILNKRSSAGLGLGDSGLEDRILEGDMARELSDSRG